MDRKRSNRIEGLLRKYNLTISEYGRIHWKIKKILGKAARCDNPKCEGKSKCYEWALIEGKKYKDDPSHFAQLCRSCHTTQDRGRKVAIYDKSKKLVKKFESIMECAKELGVSDGHIGSILNKKFPAHTAKGYYVKYI